MKVRKTLRMSEMVWQHQSELSPLLDCILRKRSAIRRKQEIEMGRARKGEEMRKKRVRCGQRGNKQGGECCQSWPKMGNIDCKAKWMDTKKDQKDRREKWEG